MRLHKVTTLSLDTPGEVIIRNINRIPCIVQMNVTQTIPNFLGGISQQPDYEKAPGFLKNAKNAYPDITYGLQKRHGARWEYDFDEADKLDGSQWFSFRGLGISCLVLSYHLLIHDQLPSVCGFCHWKRADSWGGDFTYLTKQDKNPAIPPATEAPKPTKEAYKITAINQVTVIVNRLCKVEVDTTKTVGSLTGTVTTVAELPENPSTNDVYYITNGTSTLDNYYVRWQGGAWVETVRPGIDVGLDDSTMPHALVQTATGFAFGEVPYTDRVVGNGVTNEHPSFAGTYIENSFFYLNRVGFLSTNNVVLSQPLKPNPDPYKIQPVNFYRISTLTQSAA